MKTLVLLAGSIMAVAGAVSGQTKRPEPIPVKVPFSRSLQAIVIITDDWTATQGKGRLYERRTARSAWKPVGDAFNVVVGRSGLGRGSAADAGSAEPLKNEGDGRSPSGLFPLTFAFGTAAGIPSKLEYKKLSEFTECVDDVSSSFYNRVVNRMQVGNFDWDSSEKMAKITPEYDLGIFVGYNSYPVTKGKGSCIFLHIWKDESSPTSGCTAMERSQLEKITAWLDPKRSPYLIQFPSSEYQRAQKQWKLPVID